MLEFLKELIRRKVWLFGGIYLALGWVLLQVAVVIEATLTLPSWVDQITLVLLGLGFPVALLLAWAQESQGENKSRGDKAEVENNTPAPSRLAIAVLPFADMSPDGDQTWFSDGISEEILHRLSAEKELKVAGRTSSFHFKGMTGSFEEIGQTLSVGSVLEGSVRKMDNRVRITAQLIEVATGYHIWSGTFDRELEDIFRIQEDISEAIAVALLREIGATPNEPEEKPYEPGVEAYQAFLKGRQVYMAAFSTALSTETLVEAIDWYERAIALDPNYSTAKAMLIASIAYNQGDGGTIPQDYRDMKSLVSDALESNPSPAEAAHINAHAALGEWRLIDADKYFRELETLGGLPGIAPLSHASFLSFTGRWHLALPILNALLSASPLDAGARNWLVIASYALGKYKDVKRLAEDTEALGITAPHWATLKASACAYVGDMRPLDDLIARAEDSLAIIAGPPKKREISGWSVVRVKILKAHMSGDRETLVGIYDDLCTTRKLGNSPLKLRELAEVCVLLGKDDEALEHYAFGFENHYLPFRGPITHAPDFPPRLFLTRDPRGRALMEKAGFDLAWFDDQEGGA